MNPSLQATTAATQRAALFILLVAASTLTLSAAFASKAHAADKRFALVIGYNHSDDPKLGALRYADDDALRYAELLNTSAESVTLLASLDRDTQRLSKRATVKPSAAPTRAAVIRALERMRVKMAAAKRAGHRPILYFVYSGHGNYDAEGRGYVHLKNGRFTTRDLYSHLFAPSGGDPVILMVDACNAALLVNSRGGTRRKARASRMNLEHYPNVGVILSSSSVGEVHEWGRYLAGVFSHEVRSALVGPADLDANDKVTFAELAAFIAAANDKVKNPTIRISAYIRPPLTDPSIAIIDLATAKFHARVKIGADVIGKAHLVDADMVRYADFHKSKGQSFWLGLVRPGPYTLVSGVSERRIGADAFGDISLANYPVTQRTAVRARGTHSDYFDRTLFHQPYATDFAQRYLKEDWLDSLTVERDVAKPWFENAPAWVTLGAGITALGVGGFFTSQANTTNQTALATPWADERLRLNEDLARQQTTAGILYGVGAAAVVGSIVWFIVDRPVATERYQPPLNVGLTPGGVVLSTGL